jgi:(1->4)-alpha-D-glucan 1-alpha-D-glucosylmutase
MKIPVATYRVQFNAEFGFAQARDIVDYFADLGISTLYASPVFRAKKGSSHGYDVVDTNSLNPDLGSDEEFEGLMKVLKKNGIGWIQDFVPNHMAFDGENEKLMDLLENGQDSKYYDFFDIDWSHFDEGLRNRLLTPFLGRHYGESLDAGEIVLRYSDRGFYFQYYDLVLPLKIESYTRILKQGHLELAKKLGDENPSLIKFHSIIHSLNTLPSSQDDMTGRYNQIRFIKSMLWELYTANDDIRDFIGEKVITVDGGNIPEDHLNFLDNLLAEQFFRIAFWKVASEEINYRRFFNINGLISLRMENDQVFDQTHVLLQKMIKEKKISGLRIDHIDGLYDPTGYLRRLRDKSGDLFIVVEKILDIHEELPSLWPVQGTTGYEYLNYINGIFCDETNGSAMNKLYYSYTGMKSSYEAILYEKNQLIIEKDMTGDVDNLAHLLKKISSKDRYGNDMTIYGLKKAIIEILALFPVYRTYMRLDYCSDADRHLIRETLTKALGLNPELLNELKFIEQFLLLEFSEYHTGEDKANWYHFISRFQQLTGPLMAKSLEDTTLYVYNRLLSLNEVGSSPDRFGTSVTAFHDYILKRSRRLPHSMNATSTHDTKRGEDVRARINVLSEIPEVWESNLRKWSRLNRKKKKSIKGITIPDKNDEYFLYQTLIGTYPSNPGEIESFHDRLKAYTIKAVREAKVHTEWLRPDTDYEKYYISFIEKILKSSDQNRFLEEFLTFQKMIAYYGIFNSLSQTLIKIASPGVPDFYQGTEFWDLNMVDPDNRRPVDYGLRKWLFNEMKSRESVDRLKLIGELLSTKEDGRIKLFLMYKALSARNKEKALFQKGSYIPLETAGRHKDSILSFARAYKPVWMIAIAPRFLTGVVGEHQYPFGMEVWHDTHIQLPQQAPTSWKDVITGETFTFEKELTVGTVLKYFPVALLLNTEKGKGRKSGIVPP